MTTYNAGVLCTIPTIRGTVPGGWFTAIPSRDMVAVTYSPGAEREKHCFTFAEFEAEFELKLSMADAKTEAEMLAIKPTGQ